MLAVQSQSRGEHRSLDTTNFHGRGKRGVLAKLRFCVIVGVLQQGPVRQGALGSTNHASYDIMRGLPLNLQPRAKP